MDRVKAVGVDVVREPARAADAGDEHALLTGDTQLRQHLLNLRQDGVVAAAGAPADVLIGNEVLLAELRLGGASSAHECTSPLSSLRHRPTISATLNGRPWTLLKPIASTRYSARSRRTS